MFRLLLTFIIVAAPLPVLAQQNPAAAQREVRCLVGGKSFSPGATIRASDKVNVCGADGSWTDTEKSSSGCFYADSFYSVGATAATGNGKSMIAVCATDGSWATSPASP